MLVLNKPIVEQLVDIYFKYENWHDYKMSYDHALAYHKKGLDNGSIVVYLENGEVLGYYERFINGSVCNLHNVFIKPEVRNSRVWKELYRYFFKTLPPTVVKIVGTKQKLAGKYIERIITKERLHGFDKD